MRFKLILMPFLFPLALFGQDSQLSEGKKLFMIHCSRCHGVLGKGGTGPSLTRPYLPRASTDEKLQNVIANGIPGTGMQMNWMLEGEDMEKLVTYVRLLGEESEELPLGDAVKGKALFSESICGTCHLVKGEGGSLGPELTEIGLKRGREFLQTAILHPGQSKTRDAEGFYKFLLVRLELTDGTIVSGIRVNEDTFSIQIKDANNEFHTYKKSEISRLEKLQEQSIMPSFADQFTQEEVYDIVAYLSSLQ